MYVLFCYVIGVILLTHKPARVKSSSCIHSGFWQRKNWRIKD